MKNRHGFNHTIGCKCLARRLRNLRKNNHQVRLRDAVLFNNKYNCHLLRLESKQTPNRCACSIDEVVRQEN